MAKAANVTDSTEQGATFMALPSNMRVPVLGAYASLGDTEGSRVFAARLLNEKLARSLTQQVGLDVKLVDYRAFTNDPVNAFTPLYSAALADGRFAVQRIDSQGVYASCVPVFSATGEAIALIEVLLPTTVVDASSTRLTHKLFVTALILAVLAVFAGVILSELIAGPVKALTDASVRLGQVDFSTSIPPGGAAEVGTLARTMEDMRRNLVDLTSTLRRREAEAQAMLGGIVEGVYAVDKDRIIRYLNPQAARLLGLPPEQAIGRFCGDVLKPRNEDGRRPCDDRCPILQARTDSSAKAIEHLQVGGSDPRTAVITSSGIVDGLQVQVFRDETEPRSGAVARATPYWRISRTNSAHRSPPSSPPSRLLLEGMETLQPSQQKELVIVTRARRLLRPSPRLIDNPARERPHRVRTTQHPSPERRPQARSWKTPAHWSNPYSPCAARLSKSPFLKACPTSKATVPASPRCS